MFGEHRERPPVVGEVSDTEPIVGHERMQCGREIVEEGPRLKLGVERPRDGGETDEQVGFRRRRPGVWRGGNPCAVLLLYFLRRACRPGYPAAVP